jgi:hypothetical protein
MREREVCEEGIYTSGIVTAGFDDGIAMRWRLCVGVVKLSWGTFYYEQSVRVQETDSMMSAGELIHHHYYHAAIIGTSDFVQVLF